MSSATVVVLGPEVMCRFRSAGRLQLMPGFRFGGGLLSGRSAWRAILVLHGICRFPGVQARPRVSCLLLRQYLKCSSQKLDYRFPRVANFFDLAFSVNPVKCEGLELKFLSRYPPFVSLGFAHR